MSDFLGLITVFQSYVTVTPLVGVLVQLKNRLVNPQISHLKAFQFVQVLEVPLLDVRAIQ
jgi:hypothetical protein